MQDRHESLTGVWNGEYSYPRGLRPTRFTAVLFEGEGSFSGTVHEQPTDGPSAGQVLYANVDGQRTGAQVGFVKVYEKRGLLRRDPIRYEGVLSADGCEIAGVWTIRASWSGKFLMVRPRRLARQSRAKRKVAVPVG